MARQLKQFDGHIAQINAPGSENVGDIFRKYFFVDFY